MAAILNLAILDSAILLFPLKLTHICQDWFPPFPKKKNFTHSSLFTICTKYFTHSIWLPWWWQPSWILPSWIRHFWTNSTLTQTNSIWLKLLHSHSTWWWQPSWIQPFCTKKNFSHSFWLNLMMAAILNSAILSSTILDSAILVYPLKLTHTCQDWFPPFAQKNFTHSFWLNLMMAAILNSAILHSTILHKTLTQGNSIWLKLIHSLSTWWCSHLEICHLGLTHFAQNSDSN